MRNETATRRDRKSRDLDQHIAVHSSEIREILRQILSELADKGAWLNPGLRIASSGSEFGIHCARPVSGERLLLKVPSRCLLPLHQFEISYQDKQVRITHCTGRVTPTRRTLMELMVALYNVSDKVDVFARNSPEIVLGPDHPLTLRLASGDGIADPGGTRHATTPAALDDDELKLRQFLGSRGYRTRFGSLRSVLIPIVDLLNHHARGPGFEEGKAGRFVSIDVSDPLDENQECFVNYGNYKDTLDYLRYYHFVPLTVPHLFSIPMVLSPTRDSFIYVNRGYREHELGASHFIRKLPPHLTLENNIVSCDSIRLSERVERDNLCVGMDFMVKMLGKAMGFNATEDLIRETQFNLLNANRSYYTGLVQLAGSEPVIPRNRELLENIKLMAGRQLILLDSYASKKGLH